MDLFNNSLNKNDHQLSQINQSIHENDIQEEVIKDENE